MAAQGLWKSSVFNITLENNEQSILFNSRSGHWLRLDAGRRALIERHLSGHADHPEMIEAMAQMGFLVSHDRDERAEVRAQFLSSCQDGKRLFLTIAPTMACNMRCSYCYQQGTVERQSQMSAKMRAGVVEFVRRKAPGNVAVVVLWFGGEPLLAWDEIHEMGKEFQAICAELGIRYHAEIISNGLALSPQIVADLPTSGIRSFQFSLDGLPETYAKRRQIPVHRAQAFYDFLLDSLPSLLKSTGKVVIRLNVDHDNIGEAYEVVRLFQQRNLLDPRLEFQLGILGNAEENADCTPHDCFSGTEFSQHQAEFWRFLMELGYPPFGLPKPTNHPCSAPIRNSYTIDPAGVMGKCVPATGTDYSAFVRLDPDDLEETLEGLGEAAHPFADYDPGGDSQCATCAFFPSCLGACPKYSGSSRSFPCSRKAALLAGLSFFASVAV